MPVNAVRAAELGQSMWYDNISRDLLESGELARLVATAGVRGVTSNPTIFQKAIGGSDDYDAAIQHMLDLEPYEIFEGLAVEAVAAREQLQRLLAMRAVARIDEHVVAGREEDDLVAVEPSAHDDADRRGKKGSHDR